MAIDEVRGADASRSASQAQRAEVQRREQQSEQRENEDAVRVTLSEEARRRGTG